MPAHIICISGPEGVGKDTLLRPVMALYPELSLGRKATTREPRDDDFDLSTGLAKYDHLTPEEFMGLRTAGSIVEHSQNANGHFYGSYVDSCGDGVELRDVDVNGALQLAAKAHLQPDFPSVTLIGILPAHRTGMTLHQMREVLALAATSPNWELPAAVLGAALLVSEMLVSLEERLLGRGDAEQLREQKLARAEWEIPEIIRTWSHVIVNDNLQLALAELGDLVGMILAEQTEDRYMACHGL